MKKTILIGCIAIALIVAVGVSIFVIPQVVVKDVLIEAQPDKTEYAMTEKVDNGVAHWVLEDWDIHGMKIGRLMASGKVVTADPKDYKIFYPTVTGEGDYNITVIVEKEKKELTIPIKVVKTTA